MVLAIDVIDSRDDHNFLEMIGQKPSIAILSLDLIGHPYIALEKLSISGRTFSKIT